jgi:heme/copper-type cytochrome/quinol oxidase subunit 2
MNARTRLTTLALSTAAWASSAAPAWANAVSPELNPTAAEDYDRMMYTVFGTVFGCAALIVLGMLALAVLLIVWLVRRDRRKHDEMLAAGVSTPAPEPPAEAPQAPGAS